MILHKHVTAINEAASRIFERPLDFWNEKLAGSETELAVDIDINDHNIDLTELKALHEEAKRITGDERTSLSVASYSLYRITITII